MPHYIMVITFAERLKELREKNRLSQDQLGGRVGLSGTAIGLWELNKRKANIDAVIKLANFFDVTVGYMVGTEGD